MINLQIGDYSDNGQITIVDEDKLCYLVRSTSCGASGLRTISKALLKELLGEVRHTEANPLAIQFEEKGLTLPPSLKN